MHFLIAKPSSIAIALVARISDGSIFIDAGTTAIEAFSGLVLGTLIGTGIGLSLWFSPTVARIMKPYVLILGSIPILAIAPILIVWLGVGLEMKIAMATIGTLFVALMQAYEGAHNVDPDQIRLLRIFGASKSQIFRKVIVTSSLTWVFASLKLNSGFALLGAFIGEFISSERGLGHLILRAGSLYNVPLVFAGALVIVLLAFIFNWVVEWIERRRFVVIELISMPRIIFRRNLHRLLQSYPQ
jgi:NitT/TauT family transport system permease protein